MMSSWHHLPGVSCQVSIYLLRGTPDIIVAFDLILKTFTTTCDLFTLRDQTAFFIVIKDTDIN